MKQQEFMYSGLGECLKKEWKIYLAALIFIIIADSIGQIKIPLGPGTLILFSGYPFRAADPEDLQKAGSKGSIQTCYRMYLSFYC